MTKVRGVNQRKKLEPFAPFLFPEPRLWQSRVLCPHYLRSSPLPLPPWENKVSYAALFHTSLAIFFSKQDLRLIRATRRPWEMLCKFFRGVWKVKRRGIISCTRFLLKGKQFPQWERNEASLKKQERTCREKQGSWIHPSCWTWEVKRGCMASYGSREFDK